MIESNRLHGGPYFVYPHGTKVPIARAFEKEGLLYTDIAEWFDKIEKAPSEKLLRKRLEQEMGYSRPGLLLRWLEVYPKKYRAPASDLPLARWSGWSASQRLDWLLARDNPFDVINDKGREALFYDGLLNYDDLRPSGDAPAFVQVGNDLGSYEVRSHPGEADRREYQEQRELVEEFLEGRVGHQHIVHAWPKDAALREKMAPRYIELLDAGTWFLFWRQANRNPSEVESVLTHPFLGIYANRSLDRQFHAIVSGQPKKFKDKYRMIGARSVAARDEVEGQKGETRLVDFEMRSGNKGGKREFLEDLLEARLASGDFTGLVDYRGYRARFDPAAPAETILAPWLTPAEIAKIKALEAKLPEMKWSPHPLAHNQVRNKILAPLLDWAARLPLGYKADVLARAQRRYAAALVKIATDYLRKAERVRGPPEATELREETVETLERLSYFFARRVRLDVDFERYLRAPAPPTLPSIAVPTRGPIDINAVHLGIEYTFRFPDKPRGAGPAEKEILKSAQALNTALGGGKLEKIDGNGHGHNLSIRYHVTGQNGEMWRVEWDGVDRSYENGVPVRPRGGHIETPSPKKRIADTKDIETLYAAMRAIGRDAKRTAGGAHLNMDLGPLMALPPREGARRLANLVAYFESRREMVSFLWQHPFRVRSAMPVPRSRNFAPRLNAFDGEWKDLARLLYEEQYFNPYVGRKPAYTQLNLLGVMAPVIPDAYTKPIDIRDPNRVWFPSFGGKGKDRMEFRLFDAPPDEYIAALQIKYARALCEKALNADGVVPLRRKYDKTAPIMWREEPGLFIDDAEAHIVELGLSPKEFAPLIADALRKQYSKPKKAAAARPLHGISAAARLMGVYALDQATRFPDDSFTKIIRGNVMGRMLRVFFCFGVFSVAACNGDGSSQTGALVPSLRLPPALHLPPVPEVGKGDPLIDKAWHLKALGVADVWRQHTKGDPSVTLAFIDSGIDYTHPDLAPNLRWNMAEWPPNNEDKDHNGFIDDVIGWDFVHKRYLPYDRGGHGTFLAGLAAAVEGNGIGSAGVCPRCSILPVQFIDEDGFGDTEDAIRGIDYAVMMKASVINVSFSGEGYDKHLYDALVRAGTHDIVVVAAASNDGLDLDREEIYPAKFHLPNVVTVAATDKNDKLWKHSNWGLKTVAFSAPAVDVLSIWREGKDGYDTGSGTSDAAAIVSGVVGLIRSAAPLLSAVQVIEIMTHTVRHSAALQGKLVTEGVVDANAAIQCATNPTLPCLQSR